MRDAAARHSQAPPPGPRRGLPPRPTGSAAARPRADLPVGCQPPRHGAARRPFCGSSSQRAQRRLPLLRRGIPAVVAMHYEISDDAAQAFARGFYEALAAQHPIERAVTRASAGHRARGPQESRVGHSGAFLRSAAGNLFDITDVPAPPSLITPPPEPTRVGGDTGKPADEPTRGTPLTSMRSTSGCVGTCAGSGCRATLGTPAGLVARTTRRSAATRFLTVAAVWERDASFRLRADDPDSRSGAGSRGRVVVRSSSDHADRALDRVAVRSRRLRAPPRPAPAALPCAGSDVESGPQRGDAAVLVEDAVVEA